MTTQHLTVMAMVVLVLGTAFLPAVATAQGPGENVDECTNADDGPSGDSGPPGFVGGLMPDFLGDLFSNLPVPNFVKSLFGAPTC